MVDLVAAMGFEGQAFERAEDFLQSHQVASPDCLITDVRMPGMNGLEPLERLLASGKSIPATVLTVFREEADRRLSLGAGAVCCPSLCASETSSVQFFRPENAMRSQDENSHDVQCQSSGASTVRCRPAIPRGSVQMDEFIHRENLALFKKRLSDPVLGDAERKVILKLLLDEQAKLKSSTEQRAVHERLEER